VGFIQLCRSREPALLDHYKPPLCLPKGVLGGLFFGFYRSGNSSAKSEKLYFNNQLRRLGNLWESPVIPIISSSIELSWPCGIWSLKLKKPTTLFELLPTYYYLLLKKISTINQSTYYFIKKGKRPTRHLFDMNVTY